MVPWRWWWFQCTCKGILIVSLADNKNQRDAAIGCLAFHYSLRLAVPSCPTIPPQQLPYCSPTGATVIFPVTLQFGITLRFVVLWPFCCVVFKLVFFTQPKPSAVRGTNVWEHLLPIWRWVIKFQVEILNIYSQCVPLQWTPSTSGTNQKRVWEQSTQYSMTFSAHYKYTLSRLPNEYPYMKQTHSFVNEILGKKPRKPPPQKRW